MKNSEHFLKGIGEDVRLLRTYDQLNTPLGRALVRHYNLRCLDAELAGILRREAAKLRNAIACGHLPPFEPPRLTKGEIQLGTDSLGRPIRLPLGTIARGMEIVAGTGGGKSKLLAYLLPQIAHAGCKVWAIDPRKRELRRHLPLMRALGETLIILRP